MTYPSYAPDSTEACTKSAYAVMHARLIMQSVSPVTFAQANMLTVTANATDTSDAQGDLHDRSSVCTLACVRYAL